MIRTQIQLSEEQSRLLKVVAADEGVSVAEIIRRSINRLLRDRHLPSDDEQRRKALEIVGKYASGVEDTSLEHDAYLAGIYGSSGQ